MDTQIPSHASPSPGNRINGLDELRGITLLSMVGFHVAYDIAYLYRVPLPLFTDPILQEIWRVSISWTFLALAGWMTSCSRNNVKRALEYGSLALGIWVVTSIAGVDTPISFGIIFCMAASTGIWALLERLSPSVLDRSPRTGALLLLGLFLVLYQVPRARYDFGGFAWLGFPSQIFQSSDYYPIIPFSLLYLASALCSRAFKRAGGTYPSWLSASHVAPLAWLGRHSLAIYVFHQPAAIVLLELIMR